jgi:hypothetical protein
MSLMLNRALLVAFLVQLASIWTPASAQVLGVFRWQMQPYCNVVTFTVIQQGPTYQLTGSDSLCGASVWAPATGTATPNPDGTVSLGFEIVLPTGATAHVSSRVTLADFSGPWTDADGNTGTLLYNPPAAGGSPRPEPTRSALITSAQLAASIFSGSGTATTVARGDHTHDERYFTEAETTALVTGAGLAVVESTAPVPTLTSQFAVVEQQVTTPKAGRLLINLPFGLRSVDCAMDSAYYAFLTLDGQTIPNSVVYADDLGSVPTLAGVTTAAVPAGTHTIRGEIQCEAGSWSLIRFSLVPRVSVVVMP